MTSISITMQTDLQQVLESISDLKTEFTDLKTEFTDLKTEFKHSETRLETKIDTFNEKFDNYQKATQSLVNLAFGLIASATLITVVSSVFNR